MNKAWRLWNHPWFSTIIVAGSLVFVWTNSWPWWFVALLYTLTSAIFVLGEWKNHEVNRPGV